jgi:LmbE family N-acetylglucosaminyl deacetylase
MNNESLQSIIKNKKTCYFVSPHFDDAVFSAGALMTYLSKYTDIVVVNIFTNAGGRPYTLSAKQYLKQCGFADAEKLFADREKEDKLALKGVVKKVINLGFVDALWRRKNKKDILSALFKNIAEALVVYPTYRFHVLNKKIAGQDLETIVRIKKSLKDVINSENSVIFCPMGIGSHIDHVITSKVCEEQFSDVIYWSDFPYNIKAEESINGLDSFSFDQDLRQKQQLSKKYVTQYDAIFKNGFTSQPERFFIKKDVGNI